MTTRDVLDLVGNLDRFRSAREERNANMATTADKVKAEGLEMSPSLRAYVAQRLIESLDVEEVPPLSAEWREEIRRRCDEMDRMQVELLDADEVFARAHARLP